MSSKSEQEGKKVMDPKKCPHASINRVIDFWRCNDYGAEFVPVNREHRTKW